MTMTPDTFRHAVNAMTDADLEAVITALDNCHRISMAKTVTAPSSSAGAFGAIAQDLDAAMGSIALHGPAPLEASPMNPVLATISVVYDESPLHSFDACEGARDIHLS